MCDCSKHLDLELGIESGKVTGSVLLLHVWEDLNLHHVVVLFNMHAKPVSQWSTPCLPYTRNTSRRNAHSINANNCLSMHYRGTTLDKLCQITISLMYHLQYPLKFITASNSDTVIIMPILSPVLTQLLHHKTPMTLLLKYKSSAQKESLA
jgi:hypothetical protein